MKHDKNSAHLMLGLLIVVALLAGLAMVWVSSKHIKLDPSNPIALVGMLVMFGASLTLVAVVYKCLGLANGAEAFALPSGSIRTLLAIGIMVLFTVFGLKFFDTAGQAAEVRRLSNQMMQEVDVPAADKGSEVKRYADAGLIAFPSGDASATTVKLKLYRIEVGRPAEIIDMQKQMLTAVATLLTTVIGFYFGTRSAEGAREKVAAMSGASDAEFQALDGELKTLGEELAKATDRVKSLKTEKAPPANQAAYAAALSTLSPAAEKLILEQMSLRAALAEARLQRNPAAPFIGRTAELRKSLSGLKEQLTAAEQLTAQG